MPDSGNDLEALLANADEVAAPRRGDLLKGCILAIDAEGLIVDLGKKRDGVVPRSDLQGLPAEEAELHPGDEILVMVVEPEDRDGNLLVSLSQARASGDWLRAHRMLETGEVLEAAPAECNRGGLIVPFGRLRAFVPASHLTDLPRGLDEQGRLDYLRTLVGRRMPFKVIEVDPQRRRLVLSERKAIRQWRQDQKARVIETLQEGQVLQGTVTSLREFGVFVDIGGADGLIHISELAWERVEDAGQMLQVGQPVQAMVIRLDRASSRIGLSLKRLQPMPWRLAAEALHPGQEVAGTVVRMEDCGALVRLDCGLEALLAAPQSMNPEQRVQARVLKVDAEHEMIELECLQHDPARAVERPVVKGGEIV